MFEVGLIRVVTVENDEKLQSHGRVIETFFPGIKVESKCIQGFEKGLPTKQLVQKALPQILALAKGFANKDLIVVSCADDPGVDEIRRMFPEKPVLGAGECTAALASLYGKKIALLGVTSYIPKAFGKMLGDKIIEMAMPDGVQNTLDLRKEEGRKNCYRKALELKEKGADIIVLACTGLGMDGIDREIESRTGIHVINPVLAEGLFIFYESLRCRG